MLKTPAIEAKDLEKTYKSGMFGQRQFQALKGVSFEVGRGQIFGLLGPNGAGKTTFIKILMGIIRKTGGSASLLEETAGTMRSRKKIGYLPENLRIRNHHTALSAMSYYGQLSGLSNGAINQKRDDLLELVGLSDRKKNSIKEYSKGMLQRLGLAQALLHDPELLILDEPTDGLDPKARADVRDLMERLKERGKTILMNSHILQEVELVCDRVAILDRGNLKYCGGVSDLKETLSGENKKDNDSLEVDLGMIGDKSQITTILSGRQHTNIIGFEGNVVRTRVTLENQYALDNLVDLLRSNSISISDISRQQATLEDAFLNLLTDPAAGQENLPY